MAEHLFEYLRNLELSSDYAIFGSGPLLVRGIIKSSNDLDVLCGPEAWGEVCKKGQKIHLRDYGVDVVSMLNGRITFGTHWGIGDFDTAALIESAEELEALRFVRLEYVEAYKLIRSSDKDKQHLIALREYLQSNEIHHSAIQ